MHRRKILQAALMGVGFFFITGAGPVRAAASRPPLPWEPLTAVVDGKIEAGLALVQVDEIPCLSLRDVQRLFGGRQSWRRVSRQVTYEVYGRRAEFTLDSATATIQGEAVPLPGPVRFWTGQAYLPLALLTTRNFQELTQTSVEWDPAKKTLSVEPDPEVSSPRFYSYPERSRVVLELGPRVHHRVMALRDRRLTVRFFGGRSRLRERLEIKDGLVEAVELTPKARSSDLELTLSPAAGQPRVRLEKSPRSLVIDVPSRRIAPPAPSLIKPRPAAPVLSPAPVPSITAPAPLPEEVPEEEPPSFPGTPLALSPIKTIVIDPGHGGKDAGAVGPHGTLEKDMNLAIARALARVLEREGRFRVLMTRQDDTFIPLQARTEIANKNKADLFISIHCNAALSRRSSGFEIYFVSEKATDEAAAAVARRENAVVELEGISGKAREKLQELLWALARTETLNESSEVAALLAQQAGRRISIPNRGVKQAGFYVLKGANMPAVLVESGFITHPHEEGILRSSRYHKKLADALYAGIVDYEKRKIQARAGKSDGGD